MTAGTPNEPALDGDGDGDGDGVAAFFDMDGTLLSVNSGSSYVRRLRRSGLISKRRLLRSAVWMLRYHAGLGRMEDVWLRAMASVAGQSEADTVTFSERWVREDLLPAVYPRCLALTRAHRDAGHRVVVLSASSIYAVGPLCGHLDIEDYLCTRLEVDGGCFTGRPDGPICYGNGKVAHARAFCEREGIDLQRSYFYTDSASDLPMLEAVGHPRVVNPDPRLRLTARLRGWPVTWFESGRTRRVAAGDFIEAV